MPNVVERSLRRPHLPHYHYTRAQILITSVICFLGTGLLYIPGYPFHPGFVVCSLVSAVVHLLLFLFFKRVFPLLPITLITLSSYNLILVGFIVHYSGGITSPFVFLFLAILISEAMYAIEYPHATLIAMLSYLTVAVGEYAGWFPVHNVSAANIYASPFFTAFTVFVCASFIGLTGYAIKTITRNLRRAIEEEHEKEARLRAQLSELEAPSQVGRLVNKVVHDIRGPLGAISGFVKMIETEPQLSGDSREDCRVMTVELDRIAALCDRLVKYTRPGDASRTLICPVDLLQTTMAVLSFHPLAQRVKTDLRHPAPGSVDVYGNRSELQQVYFNLLKNAVEALDGTDRPRIDVAIEKVGSSIEVSVLDNGPGMPPWIREKVIAGVAGEKLTTKKDGAGVGLIIAKEILEAYGGMITVETPDGSGTRIVTRLPLGAPIKH